MTEQSSQPPREEGSAAVLVIGFAGVLLLIVAVLSAMTSLHIERQRLYALADSASQAAADTYAADGAVGSGADPVLSGPQAHAAAAQSLAGSGHSAHLDAVSVAQDRVRVRVQGSAHPPLVGWFVPDGISVSVESSAAIKRK